MRAGTAPGAAAPAAEVANQVLQVAVHGNKNRVTLYTAVAGDGGTATTTVHEGGKIRPGSGTLHDELAQFIVGLATVVGGAVAAVWALGPFILASF